MSLFSRLHPAAHAALLGALTAMSAAFALAPPAHAELYCVNHAPCVGGVSKPTIQEALSASLAAGPDTVRVGDSATPYSGPFQYAGAGGDLVLRGDGIGDTVLSAPGGGGATLTLTGAGLGADVRVEDLTVRPASTGTFPALVLGGTAEGVRVEQATNTQVDIAGVRFIENGAAFVDGEVDMSTGRGIDVSATTPTSIRTTNIEGSEGVRVSLGGTVNVQRSRIDVTRQAVLVAGTSSQATVSNTVIRQTTTHMGEGALSAVGAASIVGVHLTLLGNGTGGGASAGGLGVGGDATIALRNSIITGFGRAASAAGQSGGTAALSLLYTAYNGPLQEFPGGNITAGAGAQANVTPIFVKALGGGRLVDRDYRLRAPSTLIDAGDPTGVLLVDLLGALRPIDGNAVNGAEVDLGAHEYQRTPPVAALSAPATATVGDTVDVSAAGTTDADADLMTYSWTFGDGTAAEPGVTTSHVYTTPGPHTITLTVTDAGGQTTTKTSPIAVAAIPVPPAPAPAPAPVTPVTPPDAPPLVPESGAPVGTPAAGAATNAGAGGTGSGADRIAPRLGRVRVAKRIRLRTGRTILSPRGPAVRFSLSEAATVTVTLRRGKRPPVRLTLRARAGTVAIRLGRRSGLRTGRYAMRAFAVDAAGNRSAARTATLRIR